MTRVALPLALIASLGLAAALAPRPALAEPARAEATPTPYERLRALALRIKPSDIGPDVSGAYGVVMDTEVDGAPATLVALSTGEASLYRSAGAGVIGGDVRPGVAEAARALVAQAQGRLGDLRPANGFPLPARGDVRFAVLTPDGALTGGDQEAALARGGRPLSPLFAAGQDVIAALRKAAAG